MKIRDLIFTDGKILSFQVNDDRLIVQFLHYTESNLEIIFRGNVSFENNDGVGYDFADSRISRNEDQWELQLLDDEYSCVFKVLFDEVRISSVENN